MGLHSDLSKNEVSERSGDTGQTSNQQSIWSQELRESGAKTPERRHQLR